MRTTRLTFQQVKHPASRFVKCPACGKTMRRSTTFSQTINPFNTNDKGQVKSGLEIKQELIEKAKQWVADADKSVELCRACSA